jgi:hypothetical protein
MLKLKKLLSSKDQNFWRKMENLLEYARIFFTLTFKINETGPVPE